MGVDNKIYRITLSPSHCTLGVVTCPCCCRTVVLLPLFVILLLSLPSVRGVRALHDWHRVPVRNTWSVKPVNGVLGFLARVFIAVIIAVRWHSYCWFVARMPCVPVHDGWALQPSGWWW